MKHDHSFTFTAAVILAGVVLALVNPTGANGTPLPADGIASTSSNLHNLVGAVAANDAPAAKLGKRGHHSKGSCPQISRVDPRA